MIYLSWFKRFFVLLAVIGFAQAAPAFMKVGPVWAASVTSADILDGGIRAVDIHSGNIFWRHFHPSLREQFQKLFEEVAALKATVAALQGGGTYLHMIGEAVRNASMAPGDTLTATVRCPGGTVVVGGGGFRTVSDATARSIVLRSSRPIAPDVWEVVFSHSAETGSGAVRDTTVHATAVCATGIISQEE